jgi:hypothetical protein
MIPLNESFQIAASDFAMALPEAFESHPNLESVAVVPFWVS